MRKLKENRTVHIPCFLLPILILASCSFDYGNKETADKSQPDIVMENVEYVRVRSGDPVARFQAERAQRYEDRRLMELKNFSFEQFEKHSGDVNAYGRAGSAEIRTDTGDILMGGGVRIEVESEDIIIETKQLDWRDNERTLSGAQGEAVNILRANGTSFSGIDFFANARRRTWNFAGSVSGTYVHDDDDEDDSESRDDTAGMADYEAAGEPAAAGGLEL